MPRRRQPKYTQSFQDRHGKWRCYFRKKGLPSVPLPGVPWSDEFMRAYAAALEGVPLKLEKHQDPQCSHPPDLSAANDN